MIALLLLSLAPGASPAVADAPRMEKITRAEALRVGAMRNLTLLVQRITKDRAEEAAHAAVATFIPSLVFDVDYSDQPPSFTPDRDRNLNYRGEVVWDTPVGSRVSVRTDTNQVVDGLGVPTKDTELGLTVSQSLLRNGWRSGARFPLTDAELASEQQRELFRDQLNALLVDVEQSYWELCFSQADLEIRKRSVQRAQKQFEETRENIRRGLVAPGEIYQVEENVVFFEQRRVNSEQQMLLARRRLAQLLLLNPDSPLVATDELRNPSNEIPGDTDAVRLGLESNGELNAARVQLARAKVSLSFERNQILPTLDVEGTVALNGLDPDLAEAWRESFSMDRPEFRAGLLLSVPLSYGPGRARVRRAKLDTERQVVQLKATETRLTYAIRDLLTQITKQTERLALIERRLELALLKLQAEQEKYRNGVTTLTDVVRFQRDLDDAYGAVNRARADLLNNHARLLRVQGVLHQARGISLDRAARPVAQEGS